MNNGSSDDTAAKISDLPTLIIKNLINQGKGASLMRGFQYLQQKVRAAICMDADTQHDPENIPKFIEAMNEYPNHIIIGAYA